jgi:hypothetical protein
LIRIQPAHQNLRHNRLGLACACKGKIPRHMTLQSRTTGTRAGCLEFQSIRLVSGRFDHLSSPRTGWLETDMRGRKSLSGRGRSLYRLCGERFQTVQP